MWTWGCQWVHFLAAWKKPVFSGKQKSETNRQRKAEADMVKAIDKKWVQRVMRRETREKKVKETNHITYYV